MRRGDKLGDNAMLAVVELLMAPPVGNMQTGCGAFKEGTEQI